MVCVSVPRARWVQLWLGLCALSAQAMPPEVDTALRRARVPTEAVAVVLQEVGTRANAADPQRADARQPGVAGQAADDAGRARPARSRPGPGPRRCGCKAAQRRRARRPAGHQGHRRSEAGGRARLAAAAPRAAAGRARDPWRHRARPQRLRAAAADPADFDGDPTRPYNVQPDALLLNFKSVTYSFVPDAPRGVALVGVDPVLADTQVERSVRLSSGPCDDWRNGLKASFADARECASPAATRPPAANSPGRWPTPTRPATTRG